jgi:hypothetical protein
MNRRRFISTALLALTPFAQPLAQTNIDGPGGRFEDDLLSNLEGDWRLSRQIRGTTVENAAQAPWVLNHQFLQLHMKDVAIPPKYEAIVLIGYIYSESQYIAYWTDTYGAKFAAIGRGRRKGNSVEFRFEYPDGPFFNTFTWLPERKEWVLLMQSQASSGVRELFAIDTLSARR